MIGIIGGGNMGEAFIEGFLKAGLSPEDIFVCDIDENRRKYLQEKYKVKVCDDPKIISKTQKIILLAVKPNQIKDVVKNISKELKKNQVLVSIAAGVPIREIKNALNKPDFTNIIRVMPNLMVAINKGILVTAYDFDISPEAKFEYKHYFEKVGNIYEVDEKLIDPITAISGSGPAFVSVFIQALADSGVYIGIPRNLALSLAIDTVFSTASMLKEKNIHPEEFKDKVTSPGGTTIEGLRVLEEEKLRSIIYKIIEATFKKAKNLN